ncbi:MAG: hypothetical protein ACREFC_14460 [Stellaceae bacterium]
MALKLFLSLRSRRSRRLEGRTILAILLILVIALPLTGCGKRAAPDPPPGTKGEFPKIYPKPDD